ncbi:MAG: M14 family zinc carboxypeptidase [Candidatus Kapaibacterium sp.]
MKLNYCYRAIAALFFLFAFGTHGTLSAQSSMAGPLINRLGLSPDLDRMFESNDDKCGPIDEKALAAYRALAAAGEDYKYDQLLGDIEVWKENKYVEHVESIGKSVQGRDIWELKITATDRVQVRPRHTITIHARTHPHEIQSWWVCQHIIQFLISDDPLAAALREQCTFYIYPMYNPDGVNLMTTRYNANGVDLEREWDKPTPQVEAAALKRRYSELMNSAEPIEIALNLHSSSDPERYFWYHHESGTSAEFARLEREFINNARNLFSRIMPWDYAVSWNGSTPTHFPESWFWFNYGTNVMALTYEDIFAHNQQTPDAYFDSAALALLHGVVDYLNLNSVASVDEGTNSLTNLALSILNGKNPSLTFRVAERKDVEVRMFDGLGREVRSIFSGQVEPGEQRFALDTDDLNSGIYYVQVRAGSDLVVKQIPVLN